MQLLTGSKRPFSGKGPRGCEGEKGVAIRIGDGIRTVQRIILDEQTREKKTRASTMKRRGEER
jgi:hypothetical protein